MNLTSLSHLHGGIIYKTSNLIFNLNINTNKSSLIKECTKTEKLINLFILSTCHLLLQYETYFEIYNFEQNKTIYRNDVKYGIKLLSINRDVNKIYLPELDSVDAIIIVIDNNNQIEIYNFMKRIQLLNLFIELQFEHSLDDCLIDEAFFCENMISTNRIHNFKDMNVFIRFSLCDQQQSILKIVNVFIDAQFEIIENVLQDDILLPTSFSNNKIILNSTNYIYMFDIGKNKLIDICYSLNGKAGCYTNCSFIDENKLLLQKSDCIELHEIREYEVNDIVLQTVLLSKIDITPDMYYISDEPFMICIDNKSSKVFKVDYYSNIDNFSNMCNIKIDNILSLIDNTHLLVKLRPKNDNSSIQLAVIDVLSQEIKQKIELSDFVVLGCNCSYLIVVNENSMIAYFISAQDNNSRFKFIEIKYIDLQTPIVFDLEHDWRRLNRCFFTEEDCFLITLYDKTQNNLNVHKFNYKRSNDELSYSLNEVNLNQKSLNLIQDAITCRITYFNNYLLLTDGLKLVSIEIETSEILANTKQSVTLSSISIVPESDDLIAFNQDHEYFFTNLLFITTIDGGKQFKIIEKKYDFLIESIKLYKHLLYVECDIRDKASHVYDLNRVKQMGSFEVDKIEINEDISCLSITPDLNYLAMATTANVICVMRLYGEREEIARLPVQKHVNSILTTNQCVSVKLGDSRLISFLIVDKTIEEHLKQLELFRKNANLNSILKRNSFKINDTAWSFKVADYLRSPNFNSDIFKFNEALLRRNDVDERYLQLLKYFQDEIRETYFIGDEAVDEPIDENEGPEQIEQIDEEGYEGVYEEGEEEQEEQEEENNEDNHEVIITEEPLQMPNEQIKKLANGEPQVKIEDVEGYFEERPEQYNGVNHNEFVQNVDKISNLQNKQNDDNNEKKETIEQNTKEEQVQNHEQNIQNDEKKDDYNEDDDEIQVFNESYRFEVPLVNNDKTIIEEEVENDDKTIKGKEDEVSDDELDLPENENEISNDDKLENGFVENESLEFEESHKDNQNNVRIIEIETKTNVKPLGSTTSREEILNRNELNDHSIQINGFMVNGDNYYTSSSDELMKRTNEVIFSDNVYEYKIYWSYDYSCMLVVTWDYDRQTTIYTINQSELLPITLLNLPPNSRFILPNVYGIICESENTICKINNQNELMILKEYSEPIKNLVLLSNSHLLVQFNQDIEIYNFLTNEFVSKTYDSLIKQIVTSTPKHTIFSSEFDDVSTIVAILFENKDIQILSFINQTETIHLIHEMTLNSNVDDCLIDCSLAADNVLLNNDDTIDDKLICIALLDRINCNLQILSVKCDPKYNIVDTEIVEFRKDLFLRPWETELMDFYNDKILLKADGSVYLYDIEKKMLIDFNKQISGVEFYTQFLDNTKLVTQRRNRIEVHEICDYKEGFSTVKTVLLLNIPIKMRNFELTQNSLIVQPGDGSRRAKLEYIIDGLKKIQNSSDIHPYINVKNLSTFLKLDSFNKDLFNYDKKLKQSVKDAQYNQVLKDLQPRIRNLMVIENYEESD